MATNPTLRGFPGRLPGGGDIRAEGGMGSGDLAKEKRQARKAEKQVHPMLLLKCHAI